MAKITTPLGGTCIGVVGKNHPGEGVGGGCPKGVRKKEQEKWTISWFMYIASSSELQLLWICQQRMWPTVRLMFMARLHTLDHSPFLYDLVLQFSLHISFHKVEWKSLEPKRDFFLNIFSNHRNEGLPASSSPTPPTPRPQVWQHPENIDFAQKYLCKIWQNSIQLTHPS